MKNMKHRKYINKILCIASLPFLISITAIIITYLFFPNVIDFIYNPDNIFIVVFLGLIFLFAINTFYNKRIDLVSKDAMRASKLREKEKRVNSKELLKSLAENPPKETIKVNYLKK